MIGDIGRGFGESLARAVVENSEVKTVALGSSGGNIAEAIKAGQMIRALGLQTTLWSNCYSACTIVFLGGKERAIWSPHPLIGFHQASIYGRDISPGSSLYRVLYNYAQSMGADPKFFLAAMFSASSNSIYTPDAGKLCDHGIATFIQRACFGAVR